MNNKCIQYIIKNKKYNTYWNGEDWGNRCYSFKYSSLEYAQFIKNNVINEYDKIQDISIIKITSINDQKLDENWLPINNNDSYMQVYAILDMYNGYGYNYDTPLYDIILANNSNIYIKYHFDDDSEIITLNHNVWKSMVLNKQIFLKNGKYLLPPSEFIESDARIENKNKLLPFIGREMILSATRENNRIRILGLDVSGYTVYATPIDKFELIDMNIWDFMHYIKFCNSTFTDIPCLNVYNKR